MKLTNILMAATTLSAIAASHVQAQEGGFFDGVYAGLETGVDWTKLPIDANHDTSLGYNAVLGIRRQNANNTVMGLEGSFGDNGYDNTALSVDTDYEIAVSLIAGKAFGYESKHLLYGKTGYVKTNFDSDVLPASTLNKEEGWRLGGGYERIITNNISIRAGADYTTYGDEIHQWQAKAGLILSY